MPIAGPGAAARATAAPFTAVNQIERLIEDVEMDLETRSIRSRIASPARITIAFKIRAATTGDA